MWEDSPYQVQQLDKIGKKLSRALSLNGIHNLTDLQERTATEIEVLAGRNPPFGYKVKELYGKTVPKYSIDIEWVITSSFPCSLSEKCTPDSLELSLTVHCKVVQPQKNQCRSGASLLVGSSHDLLFFRDIKYFRHFLPAVNMKT